MIYKLKTAGGEVVATHLSKVAADIQADVFRADDAVWEDPRPSSGAYIEELPDPAAVPLEVSMRQARDVLIEDGLIDDIEAFIEAIPDATIKRRTRSAWEYSGAVQRHFGLVSQIGAALGWSDAMIDDLFVRASTR